jgi:putative transposase
MSRIARVVAANHPHHITRRGNNRADVFFDDEDRRCRLQILQQYCEKAGTSIRAYCLMSSHVHLPALPQTAEALALCIGRTNLSCTQFVNRKYKQSGRLW